MKNLKQIENELKARGLTGDEFKDEFKRQALLFGRLMVEEIISGIDLENFDYQDAAVCLSHISEIFVQAVFHQFPSDFAENFQIEVFNASPEHTSAFCDWHDKIFRDKKTEAEAEKFVAVPEEVEDDGQAEETGAADPGDEPEVEKPPSAVTASRRRTLADLAEILEMALTSDATPAGVKDCLKSIIYEASNEAGLALTDLTLIREAFPKFILALPDSYGRGVCDMIHAILLHDTAAWKEFHSRPPDLKSLAGQIADIIRHPLLPKQLCNVIGDEINQLGDVYTLGNGLLNLEKLAKEN